MKILKLLGLWVGIGGFQLTSLYAETVILVDIDNTIFETRREKKGVFQTGFKLFRTEKRASTTQRVPQGPKEIVVTCAEFESLQKRLGKFKGGEWLPGEINTPVALASGITIFPGEYYLRDPETFDFFNENPGLESTPLEAFKRAEALASKGEGTWEGPYWSEFQKLMSDPFAASKVRTISARGHSDAEMDELWDYMIAQGYLKFKPRRYYNVARPEYDQFDLRGSVTERKLGLVKLIAQRLHRVPTETVDLKVSRDGIKGGYEEVHTLILVDDRPETIRDGFEELQALAQAKVIWAKFGLFNMGLDDEVEWTERPRYLIFDEIGGYREATEAERTGELLETQSCAEAVAEMGE